MASGSSRGPWVNCIPYRAETIRSAHDTIWYAMRCTRYDTFRDTFAFLTWEAEACDHGLRSEVLQSTDYNGLHSNDAQWLQQWRPPQSFQMQCVCDEFTHFIGIYWLFLWYLVFVSNFGMCYICIVSSSERIAIRTVAFVSAIYRCASVSFQP